MAKRTRFRQAYNRLADVLPPQLAGRLDLLRPAYSVAWGGPLNGQHQRRTIVRDLARAIEFDRVLETGTYRGTSTEFLLAVFGTPVETVEANHRLYVYSHTRLTPHPEITVVRADSRPRFLRNVLARSGSSTETVFFYLDAHWEDDLPLAEELEIIARGWRHAVVMIDDFQVCDDAGYGYDDYGEGMALTEDYLPASALAGWSMLYPAAPSSEETGMTRGSCILASPAVAAATAVPSLRLHKVFEPAEGSI